MSDSLIVSGSWGIGHCTDDGPPPPGDVDLSEVFPEFESIGGRQ